MSDPAPIRPSAGSLRPVISVLARTLLGGEPFAPSAASAPSPPVPGALPGAPALPRLAPAWARALSGVLPDGHSLGSALDQLTRVIERGGPQTREPQVRAIVDLLARMARVDGLDGEELRQRLESVDQALEARFAARAAGGGVPAKQGLDVGALLGLKARLLQAFAALPEGELRAGIEAVLASLDGEQLYNLARAEHGESPVWQLPLPDGDGWSAAWFQRPPPFADTGSGRDDGQDSQSTVPDQQLTVGLTLSALGPLRIDLALRADALRIRLAVSRQEVRCALERDLPLLIDDLARVGRAVSVRVELADARELGPPVPVVDGQVDVVG